MKTRSGRKRMVVLAAVSVLLVLFLLYFFLEGPGRPVLEDRGLLQPRDGPQARDDAARIAVVLPGGLPKTRRVLSVLENRAYIAGYDEALRMPAWVAYRLPWVVKARDYAAREGFVPDDRIRATFPLEALRGSDYAAVPLAPPFALSVRFGAEASAETRRISNAAAMSPGLRDGVWASLLEKAAGRRPDDRCWASLLGEVFVVCGPVFFEPPDRPAGARTFVGDGSVRVPDAFYAVLLDVVEDSNEVRALAFLFQNREERGRLEDYLVSVDAIELWTGLDFLWELDDAAETGVEAEAATALWRD